MFFCFAANASASQEKLENALSNAKKLKLESNVTWHALLHFEAGIFSSASAITNEDFFLSVNGPQDPSEELNATVSAFFNSPNTQCRFPARLMWLKTMMPHAVFPSVECAEYQAYMRSFTTNSISVVYASGYLGNPASMFGHVLLKFNRGSSNELLDNTYSYGATVPETDNKLTYIFKGITGGYQGHFANQKYHHQNLTYTESELRDLWEYRLKLSQDEIDLILAHLWEIENTSMAYYFFKENCGYQLAKLLEIVMNKPLLAPNKPWVMPYDLVMMLNKPETNHYIDEIIYHGSRQQDLYTRFNQLTEEEKQSLGNIVNTHSQQTLPLLRVLDEKSEKKVIDTLYDYYAFIEVKNDGLADEQSAKKKQLLTERFNLPAEKIQWEKVQQQPPHQAQNTAMMQISPLYNASFGYGLSARFRVNYYDLLNLNAARIPYSALRMLDLSLLYTDEQKSWSIREFTLFNIINLNVSQTGLVEDALYAWELEAGYKPTSLSCVNCSDIYVSGFLGKSKRVTKSGAGYIALAAEIQLSDFTSASLLSGPEIGVVLNLTPYWATSLKARRAYNINKLAEYEDNLVWEQRFFEDRDFDVRTSITYNDTFEYAINLSTYW